MIHREIMEKIWNMQGELNVMVGRDTLNPPKNRIVFWKNQYVNECKHELFEAMNEFYHKWWIKEVKDDPNLHYSIINRKKLKIELIDALHFIISANHLYYCELGGFSGKFERFYEDIYATYGYLEQSSDSSIKSDRWLYWTIVNIADQHVILEITKWLFIAMDALGMDENEILRIYTLKWEKNKLRQQTNYSHAKKDEQDNEEIERSIRK